MNKVIPLRGQNNPQSKIEAESDWQREGFPRPPDAWRESKMTHEQKERLMRVANLAPKLFADFHIYGGVQWTDLDFGARLAWSRVAMRAILELEGK